MFDLTNRFTFQALEHWIADLKHYAPDNIPRLLLGNKCDMQGERQVGAEEAQTLADSLGILYFEVSSKDDDAQVLEEIFRGLATLVVSSRTIKSPESSVSVSRPPDGGSSWRCCS